MEYSKWKEDILGELTEYIIDYRGKTPKKSATGIPTLSAKSVKDNWIDYSEAYYISKYEYKRFMVKGFPKVGDILLTMEAPLGLVATLDRDDVGLAQRIVTISGKKGTIDNRFLKYYLQSPYGQHELLSKATGTTVVGISQKNLRNVRVKFPRYSIQLKLSNLLESYEKKIEINKKIIANLEAQAQALFKYYFVDFGPFADGNFVDSDLGPIPEGWEVIEIENILDFKKGRKPKKDSLLVKNGIPYLVKGVIDGNELPEFTIDEKIIHINDLDIFMLMDGANSGNIYYGFNGALGSTFSKLEIKTEILREIIYQYILLNLDIIKNQNTGSAIPHANKDYINKMKLAIPSENIMKNICDNFKNMRQMTISLRKQNQTLAETRDALLPKLMAGEIDLENLGGPYD